MTSEGDYLLVWGPSSPEPSTRADGVDPETRLYVSATEVEPAVRKIIDEMGVAGEEWYLCLGRSNDSLVTIGDWEVNTVQAASDETGLFITEFLVDGPTGHNDGWAGRLVRRHILDHEDPDDAEVVGQQTVLCLFRCFVEGKAHPSFGVAYDYEVAWRGDADDWEHA